VTNLEFYFHSQGGYRYVPHVDETGAPTRTNYVSLPTDLYDPQLGGKAIHEYVDTLAFAERLGFDGILHSEQHGSPIGLSGNALVTAAWLAARTEHVRIVCAGPVMNGYLSPVRMAEEIALVDNLSRGRLSVGLPMGIGPNYHAQGVTNPAYARERYREGLDLLLAAMTRPGPFEWEGKFFHVPYVNLWPRPVQQPYPEIWVPVAGSRDSLKLCADRGFVYMILLSPPAVRIKNAAIFRELCEEQGYTPDPRQTAVCAIVHVAETDRQARREAEPHILWLFQHVFGGAFPDWFPPGQVSPQSLRGMLAGGYRSGDMAAMTFDELSERGWVVVGSPSTVSERLEQLASEADAGRMVIWGDFISNPDWLLRKSMTLFAEEVIPRFRAPDGKPVWARADERLPRTNAEWAALGEERATPRVAMPDDGIVDLEAALSNGSTADVR
jgi:alkanesulfonate monooxygenase SsuD/methylene tetrahydromethanopterin reductase-like flavin-dependent oxidoreductase (luciferase family)